MFEQMSYQRFAELAKSHQRIAVHRTISGDTLTPTRVFLALRSHVNDITLLESNPKEKHLGRHSFLCFDPLLTFSATGNQVTIKEGQQQKKVTAEPFDLLRKYQAQYTAKTDHPLAGFVGGMVGFMSYDAVRLIEDIADRHPNHDQIPDVLFRFYQHNISFDHEAGKVVITTVVEVNDNSESAYQQAIKQLECIHKAITQDQRQPLQTKHAQKPSLSNITVDIDDAAFCEKVKRVKEFITEGEVFQTVLSRTFSINITSEPFAVYRALRFSNPSPYMFYLEIDGAAIAGASPEKLITIKDGVLESCPLAGTRRRGATKAIDDALAEELLADEKETAEHMMLVDLARNDLGHVAIPGSVKVSKRKEIEKYARVMHISSTVQAQLDPSKDVFDALKASFPAGTLSGAPKIRAMNLIDELEENRRGIYGGVICAIDSQNELLSCIAIRTTFIKNGVASVRAGAGVVYDSNPQAEADETRHKAKAILEGILLAQGEPVCS